MTLSSTVPFAPLEARDQIDRRIDYVLARRGMRGASVVVDRAFTAGDPVDGRYPSDHFATVADIAI